MAERRIGYATDKVDIVRRLLHGDEATGPFRLIADVLVFAAALGLKKSLRIPLGESQEEPIRQEVFDRKGYDTMMNLLALHATRNPEVLSESDEMVEARAKIFEEYANGGLEVLREELRGALDPLETMNLLLNADRAGAAEGVAAFDLTRLV